MAIAAALPGILSAASSIFGGLSAAKAAKGQMKMQKEFAQNAIQWKTQDALKAGVHPAFALGAPTISYSPVQVGQVGDAVANAGQDIGRAAAAVLDSDAKATIYTKALQALQLERGGLENELLKSQIRRMNEAGTPPPAPGGNAIIDGQGDTRAPVSAFGVSVKPKASESQAQTLENEYGEISDWVGGARLLRDADKPLTAKVQQFLWGEFQKMLRGEANHLFYLKRR